MSVTDEELMAYVDGELPQDQAARMTAAISLDPALSARVDAHRHLRAILRGHLDPVAAEPVPESLTLLIASAAADQAEREMTDASQPDGGEVVNFAAAKESRKLRASKAPQRVWPGNWRSGVAIAASLALGLVLGTQLTGGSDVVEEGGQLVASGSLASGLDTQLAASQGPDLQILTSFQRKGGDYCRVYSATATAGIACKEEGRWVLERSIGHAASQRGEYRQAGSAQTELMAAAQDMAEGDPLDANGERRAVGLDWKR